ncbi:MAG: hypothetical protein CMO55_26875 [Verrucomicrobiales bacterium]|nr:hypothetical protein [Verrucomicrobiales bacterium]
MKRSRRLSFVLGIALISLLLLAWFAPNKWLYSREFRTANNIIEKIEGFRSRHGFYPESLSAFGIEESEEGPYHYERIPDGSFQVWFGGGKGFFSCQTYDSKIGSWAETD